MLHKEKVNLYLENMDYVEALFKTLKSFSGSVSEGPSPQSKWNSSQRIEFSKRTTARSILLRLMQNDSNSSIAESLSRRGSRGSFNQEEQETSKPLKTSSFGRTSSISVKDQEGAESLEGPTEAVLREVRVQEDQFTEDREFTFGSKRKRKGSPIYSELNSEASSVKETDNLLEVPMARSRKRVSFEADFERKEGSNQAEDKHISLVIPFASPQNLRPNQLERISEEHEESQDHYVLKKSDTLEVDEVTSSEITLFKRPGKFMKSRTVTNMDEVVSTRTRRLSSNVTREVKLSDQLKLFAEYLERNKHRINPKTKPIGEFVKPIRRVSSDLAVKYQNQERKSEQSQNVGISIFDFDFLAPIGKGGFGKVWMVKRRTTEDLYAVKIIKFSNSNPNFIHDLVNENKIMMKVVGDYVVKGIISFMYDRFYCIVMELM